jgi:type II secretory pathway pseudopilin PulG
MKTLLALAAIARGALTAATMLAIFAAAPARAQAQAPPPASAPETHETEPAAALAAALGAACRANDTQFANYLTADNAAAFRALPQDQRAIFLKHLSVSDEPGKTLISSDPEKHTVLRCEAAGSTVEYRFGETRLRENLAFIPVTVVGGNEAEFGLVRENGAWRLLSIGLLLLDIPQLSKEWAAQDFAAREDAAIETLRGLADAIRTYRNSWGRLPESLAELGPAPTDQVSPEQSDLVNEHLAAGSQGGYQFRYHIVPAPDGTDPSFELAASPEEYGKTGRRSFLFDSTGKIRGADKQGAVATPEDPLIPGEKTE